MSEGHRIRWLNIDAEIALMRARIEVTDEVLAWLVVKEAEIMDDM